MCGNYFKTKSEIMKHYQKDHKIFFYILNRRSWDFQLLLEKAKSSLVDSSPDKPKALIRNVASQPLIGKVNTSTNNNSVTFKQILQFKNPSRVFFYEGLDFFGMIMGFKFFLGDYYIFG